MVDLNKMDWDQVRIFLATCRAKSLRQAAEQLGLSHPTARRHLNAFEDQLGLRLFDRRSDGLHSTPEAEHLRVAAESVERAMQALGRVALAADHELRGSIRVTLPGLFGADVLMPVFADFIERYPEIELIIDADYAVVDLNRHEADVAIRAMAYGKSPAEHLAGRKVGTSFSAVYGEGEVWIGWYGAERDRAWVADTPFPDLPIRGAIDDVVLQRAACAAGMGLSFLPCALADGSLPRRSEPQPAYDLWVLVHPDLRDNPRLRIFRDHVVHAMRGMKDRLEGRCARPPRSLGSSEAEDSRTQAAKKGKAR